MKPVRTQGRDLQPAQASLTHLRARSLGAAMSGVPILRGRAQRFERPLVYFRFTPDEFILSVAGSEETYRSTPHLALDRHTRQVKEIGPEAPRHARGGVVVENGFRYSGGLIISDMDVAEIAFRYTFEGFMMRVRKGQLPFMRWMKPDLLIHPLHVGPGQLTSLELRALSELGGRCGTRKAFVYLGPELSDLELRTGSYITAN
jgi:hypothetical protein